MEKEHEHTQSENGEKVKSTPQFGSGPQLQSPLREPGASVPAELADSMQQQQLRDEYVPNESASSRGQD
jgi:hypothetical protein